jgi:glycopeptide antibiotics resistance protein
VNLVPFNYGHLFDLHLNVIFLEIFGNILLTVPFGFGIPFLARFKPKNFPWLAIGSGLAIETAQLGFCLLLGANYRTVDINDVLLNATGALLGYTLFRGFAWLYSIISNRIKIKQSGLFAYVYEVAIYATF